MISALSCGDLAAMERTDYPQQAYELGKTYDKKPVGRPRAPGGPFLSWKEIPCAPRTFPMVEWRNRGKGLTGGPVPV